MSLWLADVSDALTTALALVFLSLGLGLTLYAAWWISRR